MAPEVCVEVLGSAMVLRFDSLEEIRFVSNEHSRKQASQPQKYLSYKRIGPVSKTGPDVRKRYIAQILYFSSNLRAMTVFWISEVPSPMSRKGASR